MVRRVLGVVGVLVVGSVAPSAVVAAPPVATQDFACTGSEQSWDAPVGVTTVDVVTIGARGGTGGSGKPGGAGAVRSGTVPVVPGQRLWVEVGCDGGSPGAGGFNGGGGGGAGSTIGGGGGGASDVRSVPRLAGGSLESRLIVAAGGGGGGAFFDGGAGGAADEPGAASSNGRAGGGAGSLTAGGLPGGVFGVGGPGLPEFFDGGGGGGGGYYGGGGGTGNGSAIGGSGGGGGGSSFFASQVVAQGTAGGAPGDAPRVSLTYDVPTADLSAGGATFGGVQVLGTVSAPQTVSITNAGDVPLVVTGLLFEGANPQDFLLGSTDCVSQVAGDTTCTLGLRFAPQASGARAATLRVKTSIGDRTIDLSGVGGEVPQAPTGAAGTTTAPQGLPAPSGKDGQLVLVAYQATASRAKATVRYALTGPADVTLKVKPPKGAAATVAKAKGRAGINQVSWNRKLKGRKAGKGTYKLTITATAGGKTVSSTLTIRLK